MNELVFKGQNDQVVTTSLKVAEVFGKEHQHILRDIRDLIKGSAKNIASPLFKETTYTHPQNRQQYPMFLLSMKGLKLYLSHSRGVTPLHCKALGVDDMDIVYSYTRFETAFVDMLEKALCELGIEGYRQYNVDNKYRIDFYIPSKKLAVEYDEAQHLHQEEADKARETYIQDKLDCKFIRLDYRDEDIINVMKVIKQIIK